MARQPISHKQLAANRANAAKSTGPRTPEGKARSARLEAGLFTDALDETLIGDEPFIPMCKELAGDGDIRITRAQNRNFALGEGFRRLAKKSNCWALFFRYQAQSERLYRRAVEEFERLKALRGDLPNQPIDEPETEENQYPDPSETNPSADPPVSQDPPPSPAPDPAPDAPSAPASSCGEIRAPDSREPLDQPKQIRQNGVFGGPSKPRPGTANGIAVIYDRAVQVRPFQEPDCQAKAWNQLDGPPDLRSGVLAGPEN